jgi:hypothetical protein
MYKLIKDSLENINAVQKLTNNDDYIFIPFASHNIDYQTFKKEVLAGAELQDVDENVMTQEQANEFIATLP